MSDQTSLGKRAALLSKAVKACKNLNIALDEIRSLPLGHLREDTTTIRTENRCLQVELVEQMRAAAERRNEVVSPFASLTDDIVRKIFEMATACVGTNRYDSARWEVPVYLSHVCRHWRLVALDSPRLWASIDLMRPLRAQSSFGEGCPAFRSADVVRRDLSQRHLTFIERARSVPFQVMLNISLDTTPESQGLSNRLLGLCKNHVCLLHLFASGNSETARTVLSCISRTAPSLRELVLARLGPELDGPEWSGALETFFSMDFPALNSVAINGFPLPATSLDIQALKNCRALSVTEQFSTFPMETATSIFCLLTAAPGLEELILRSSGPWRQHNVPSVKPVISGQKIHMARLVTIVLSFTDKYDSILPFIEAPVLQRLELDMTVYPQPFGTPNDYLESSPVIADTVKFLRRTNSLDALCLRSIPSNLLCSLLDATPTITRLCLISSLVPPHSTACSAFLDPLVFHFAPSPECVGLLTDLVVRRRSVATPWGQECPAEDCYQAAEGLAEFVYELYQPLMSEMLVSSNIFY